MNLAEYFKETGIPKTFFCNKIRISYPTLFKVLNGQMANLRILYAIEQGTEGKVTVNDLISLLDKVPKKKKAKKKKEVKLS